MKCCVNCNEPCDKCDRARGKPSQVGQKFEHLLQGIWRFMQSDDVRDVDDSPTRCHIEGVCRRLKAVSRRRT